MAGDYVKNAKQFMDHNVLNVHKENSQRNFAQNAPVTSLSMKVNA